MPFGFRVLFAQVTGLLLFAAFIGATAWLRGASDAAVIALAGGLILGLWVYPWLRSYGDVVPVERYSSGVLFAAMALALALNGHWDNLQAEGRQSAGLGELGQGACLRFGPPMAILFGPLALVRLRARLRESRRLRRWLRFGRGGSARFAGPHSLRRRRIVWLNSGGCGLLSAGVYMGRSMFEDDWPLRHIAIEDDAHLLTVGLTGSGKSATSIAQAISIYAGSAVVLDPKGEHAKRSYHRRHDSSAARAAGCVPIRGAKGIVLDPFEIVPGVPRHSFNPLAEIDLSDDRARMMISGVAQALVIPERGDGKHWEEMARLLIEGLIVHVKTSHPEGHRTLPAVFDLLQGIDPETGVADPERFEAALIDMRCNPAAGGVAQQAAAALGAMGERERGSVLSSAQRSLKWASDPAMRRALADSDFRFGSLGGAQPTTVYLAVPFEAMREHARWLRVVLSSGIRSLERARTYRRADIPILFVLDEFLQTDCALEVLEQGVATLRGSAQIKLWCFAQQMSQLQRVFGENWQSFIANSTVQLFGVNDLDTARWVEGRLGEQLVRRKRGIVRRRVVEDRAQPLMKSSEVIEELGKSRNISFVFPTEGLPMRLERLAYQPLVIDGRRFRGLPLKRQLANCD